MKLANKILLFVLAVLGISSVGGCAMKYGTNEAEYIIRGSVTDAGYHQPVQGISVVAINESTITDNRGYYIIHLWEYESLDHIDVHFTDSDTAAYGNYASIDTSVAIDNISFFLSPADDDAGRGKAVIDLNISLPLK